MIIVPGPHNSARGKISDNSSALFQLHDARKKFGSGRRIAIDEYYQFSAVAIAASSPGNNRLFVFTRLHIPDLNVVIEQVPN